ncbi:MAG: glycosyltransferase family 39 protein [Nitrospira sp.]|nr:glycosyltransferase family 39 protein [bacterium]MBL7050281.1 glycosyltransferase family 39 protein [Nitrospira sp.]
MRLTRYIFNPALWFDESVLAVDIITRSFPQLIQPSQIYNVSLPLGFAAIEKLIIQFLGYSEYAFRLFPLLTAVASLILFYVMAKKIMSPGAVLMGLALFVFSDQLVHFATEFKPYASDGMFTILIYMAVLHVQSENFSSKSLFLLASIGIVAPWFSNPSVFVLAGAGSGILLSLLAKRKWDKAKKVFIVGTIWLINFGLYFQLYLKKLTSNDIKGVWTNDLGFFMPFPPSSLPDIKWFFESFFGMFHKPLGLTLLGIGVFLFMLGIASMLRNRKENLIILTAPIVIAVLASAFQKYVIYERMLIFYAPFMIILISEGFSYLQEKTRGDLTIATVLTCLLFIHPMYMMVNRLANPPIRQNVKPLLQHIKQNWQQGDIIYIYYKSEYQFEYYAKHYPDAAYNFNEDQYFIGTAPPSWDVLFRKSKVNDITLSTLINKTQEEQQIHFKESVRSELKLLTGYKRVWALYSLPGINAFNSDKFYLDFFNALGKKTYSVRNVSDPETQAGLQAKGGMAALYRYDILKNGNHIETIQ